MSKIWQPLDPEFVHKLAPEYVEFHKAHLIHRPRADQLPWSASIRDQPAVLGSSDPLPVASIKDYSLSETKVRVLTPEGEAPSKGWPVFIYFHGGGWTLGDINTEVSMCSNMCNRAKCVVVSVNYRLAPEHPYPAAVDDTVESLEWVLANKAEINVDVDKIATGGSSSGGNLAAILTHKAALMTPPVPLIFQLLVVPVTDNTASESGDVYPSWAENAKTAGLAPSRMLWFRNFYLPNEADRTKWDNSPMFAPDETFAKAPNAWIGVGECDILRDEGVFYGEKLKKFGKEVDTVIYKGAPHPIMAMDGEFLPALSPGLAFMCAMIENFQGNVLEVGKQMVSDAAAALAKAFGTA